MGKHITVRFNNDDVKIVHKLVELEPSIIEKTTRNALEKEATPTVTLTEDELDQIINKVRQIEILKSNEKLKLFEQKLTRIHQSLRN